MSEAKPFNDITLEDLKAGLARGIITLIDVREADEYAAGHIKNALLNPLSTFDVAQLPAPQPGQQIIIYCRSGRRSISAMEKAQRAGRTDIFTHYSGGILGWVGGGEPVVQEA